MNAGGSMTNTISDEELERLKRGPWVVVIGTLWQGFRILGPFKDLNAAETWADDEPDAQGFCVLEEPENKE
jgi:hypothetical protein